MNVGAVMVDPRRLMPVRHHTFVAAVLALLVAAGCSSDPTTANPIPAGVITPTAPSSPTADIIEYRVFGNIGSSSALIEYSDSLNGLTVLSNASLPYTARVASTAASTFLYLEASATQPLVSTGTPTLQVQIIVNGQVFREAFATGLNALLATAEGTWHH